MTDSNGIKLVAENAVVTTLMQSATEDSVALAFTQVYHGRYVYAHGWGKWLRWDGQRWCEDKTNSVRHEIRQLARRHNPEGKAATAKNSFYAGVEMILRSDPGFSRDGGSFDRDNYLLNTPDGTYDLMTGEKRDHDPLDNITKLTWCSPRGGEGKRFLRFLEEVTDGNKALEEFLQVSLGACLSGAVEEHWLLCWTGVGRNGKNTLGDLVIDAMGDYARVIPSSTLMSQRNPEHKTELMNLRGMRLVASGEIEEGAHWAEAKMKELTGDAEISARYTGKDYVTFKRTHKHLIYGNYRPQLRNTDLGVRSRLRMVPFKVSFEGREDADLPRKLRAEVGFVMQWLLEGHAKWLKQGKRLGSCSAVDAEFKDYLESQSTIDQWVSECCVVVKDPEQPGRYWEKASVLYRSYKAWKLDRGEQPVSQTRFGESLSRTYPKTKADVMRYVGIKELVKK
jgi:P4 family phage/plasmid primase-like protien